MYKKQPVYLVTADVIGSEVVECDAWNMRDRVAALLDLFPLTSVTITRKPEDTP